MPDIIENKDNNFDLENPPIGDGIVLLPEELKDAPQVIKDYYLKWLSISKDITNNKSRYFQFINTQTNELEQVDAMGLPGNTQKLARQKNISEADFERFNTLCDEMLAMKKLKTSYKLAWLKYVRPRMGRDVFDWRKSEIVDMFSKYMTVDEVKEKLQALGYVVEINNLFKFFLNNKDVIDKKRIEFIRTAKDHYLATDAGRMETLAMLHSRFIKLFNETYYSATPNKEELRAISREIRGILEQARKEIKGEEIRMTIDGTIDINASINAARTIQEVSKRIPIHIIPVYLTAAKAGINPNLIITSLVNSFYKDFNGFNKIKTVGKPITTGELIRNYDWNEITFYQENKKPQIETELTEYEEVPFTKKTEIKTKRDKLMDFINGQIIEGDK